LDITFPFKTVTVHVQDSTGAVSSAKVDAGSESQTSFTAGGIQFTGRTTLIGNLSSGTDQNGDLSALLFAGDYIFDATPPTGSNDSTTATSASVTSDTTINIPCIDCHCHHIYVLQCTGETKVILIVVSEVTLALVAVVLSLLPVGGVASNI